MEQEFKGFEAKKEFLESGYRYLEHSSEQGLYKCYLSPDRAMVGELHPAPAEIGTSLLVLETALRQRALSEVAQTVLAACKDRAQTGHINFFLQKGLLPDDADTTSYGLATLLEMGVISREFVEHIADEIIKNSNNDGIIQVYFKPEQLGKENRLDHVALANILNLLSSVGKDGLAIPSCDFVLRHLLEKTYLEGSRYYHSPDIFLYFLGRLMKFPVMRRVFGEGLSEELRSRIGSTEYPLDLAMRITTARRLGFENQEEREKLRVLQNADGSWPSDSIYHYGGKAGYFGSQFISTGFAIEALGN